MFVACSRSRRDCGNLEAASGRNAQLHHRRAAVAATAAILRRPQFDGAIVHVSGRSRRDCGNLEAALATSQARCLPPAAVAATAAILRRASSFCRNKNTRCRSRRDCGNLEADSLLADALERSRGRSRRDCGNLEAVFGAWVTKSGAGAAVAATAAILRRFSCRYCKTLFHSRSRAISRA